MVVSQLRDNAKTVAGNRRLTERVARRSALRPRRTTAAWSARSCSSSAVDAEVIGNKIDFARRPAVQAIEVAGPFSSIHEAAIVDLVARLQGSQAPSERTPR
jgi:hypothetical protein